MNRHLLCLLSFAVAFSRGQLLFATTHFSDNRSLGDTVVVYDSAGHVANSSPLDVGDFDVIVLRGGSNIRGKILKYDPLTVQLPDSSRITLNMSDVISITRESATTLQRPSRPPSVRRPSLPSDRSPVVEYERRRKSVALFGGVALPVSDFGESNVSTANAGYAKSGFAFGLDWNSSGRIVQGSFGTLVTINGSDFGSVLAGVGMAPSVNVSVESGSWVGIWPMVGVRLVGELSDDLEISARGMLGAVIGFSPEITITARNTIGQTASATIDKSTATALAYGGGFGVTLSYFDLSFSYLAGSPEYEFKSSGQTMGKGKQPMSIILITAGLRF